MKKLTLLSTLLFAVAHPGFAANQAVYIDGSTGQLSWPNVSAFYLANPVQGSGAALTDLNATNLATGTVPLERLPTSIGLWTGTVRAGVYPVGQHVELWSNVEGTVNIDSDRFKHGLIVHSTGAGGMAIIGRSSTGAQALKAVQDTYYTQPALTVYRATPTGSGDKAEVEIKQTGAADLLRLVGNNGSTTRFDSDAALHLPALDDVTTQSNTIYFSNSQQLPVYQDNSGTAHPLYNSKPVFTPPGINGNTMINALSGTVRFAPGATSLILTNSYIGSTTRFRMLQVQIPDGVSPDGIPMTVRAQRDYHLGTNSAVYMYLSASAPVEVEVYWEIINP